MQSSTRRTGVKIINEPLLKEFREKERCERCGRTCLVQPHHLFSKGMGGARRFDIRANLISLCLFCHEAFHRGGYPIEELLAIVAKREKTTHQAIREQIWHLRRL